MEEPISEGMDRETDPDWHRDLDLGACAGGPGVATLHLDRASVLLRTLAAVSAGARVGEVAPRRHVGRV